MTSLAEGDRFYCAVAEMAFEVCEDIDTAGMSTAEMDHIGVRIKYEDGQQHVVPHERFRGRRSYERLEGDR